jgi:hypothetical protein
MTLSTVAVDDPILASREQEIIAHVNASPGRAIFTSNGTFSIPNGVHKFRVYLAAGGGGGIPATGGDTVIDGSPGPNAHLVSAEFAGIDIGTSFAVTVGAGGIAVGGMGGTSSFGPSFSATGAETGTGSKGTVTWPAAPNGMYHANGLFMNVDGKSYGQGGDGGTAFVSPLPGMNGIVVVEW